MKTNAKQLIALSGWLAVIFFACTAHADLANKVRWTMVVDFDPYHVGEGKRTFHIEDATCEISAANGNPIRSRSMSCDVGGKHIADAEVFCIAGDNDVHLSSKVIVGNHVMQLGCTGANL